MIFFRNVIVLNIKTVKENIAHIENINSHIDGYYDPDDVGRPPTQ